MRQSEFRQFKDKYGASITKVSHTNYDFYMQVIRAYCAAYVPREFWLTEREEELLVNIMCCLSDGHKNIFTNEGKDLIGEYFKTFKNKKTLQVWLPKLVDKDWIKDFGDGRVVLLQEFYPFLKNNKVSLVIDFYKIIK